MARRMSRLGTETAFEVLVKARALEKQGRDIVHLEIGEPDFDTPGHIIEAACEALHRGYTHYGPSAGMPESRQAIADDVAASRGIQVSPEEVVVVPGGKPIMYFIITALVDHGDEVIYPNPGFPIYESMINFVGGTPVPIPLREELDFRLDVKELAGLVNERTKLIILNSPQNPTGGVLTESDIDGIADAVSNCNAMVLSDEIYCRLIFEGKHHSILKHRHLRDRIILLDGFSKTYAMTGWRMGYGMMRRDLADQIARLQTNSNSCTASFTQMAGVAALKGDQELGWAHARRVQAPPRLLCRAHQPHQGLLLQGAEGSLLHVPEHHQVGLAIEKAGRRAAAGGRGGNPFRNRLWRLR